MAKKVMILDLTPTENLRLIAAIRLRAEACEENEETTEATAWRKLLEKVEHATPS